MHIQGLGPATITINGQEFKAETSEVYIEPELNHEISDYTPLTGYEGSIVSSTGVAHMSDDFIQMIARHSYYSPVIASVKMPDGKYLNKMKKWGQK
jgi:L-asparaginase/Glu-tRNA(Gln) amidotransferase subunit D